MMPAMTDGRLHVAIIMDGNGRWATGRGLSRAAGHRAGVDAARRVVRCAPGLGIGRLTLYAFSSDNWRRPAPEVEAIFWLIRAFLRLETARLARQGVCLQMIGRRDRLPRPVLSAIERAEAETADGRHLHLVVAIDYSSREAIARTAAEAARAAGVRRPGGVQALPVIDALNAQGQTVDLLIRTGGEKRLSDFLLWESAYAELLFSDRFWPEFTEADLEDALREFRRRERRFGALPHPGFAAGDAHGSMQSHE